MFFTGLTPPTDVSYDVSNCLTGESLVPESGEFVVTDLTLCGTTYSIEQQFVSKSDLLSFLNNTFNSMFGYNHNNQTAYNGTYRILPNNIYSWDLRYPHFQDVVNDYNPDIKKKVLIPDTYEKRMEWIREELFESTRRRLLSKNYPISVLLSGGLDSTIITSILHHMGAKVNYFTIENGEDDFYVRECENYFGINVRRLKYSLNQ